MGTPLSTSRQIAQAAANFRGVGSRPAPRHLLGGKDSRAIEQHQSVRFGSSAESWQVRMEKLRNGRSFGRFFAASREKMRELARRLKVRHLVNLVDARPHYETLNAVGPHRVSSRISAFPTEKSTALFADRPIKSSTRAGSAQRGCAARTPALLSWENSAVHSPFRSDTDTRDTRPCVRPANRERRNDVTAVLAG